ncbi:uncharacterized protein [Haliotis cracherodii]|uniref:uncharacterized protein n=1 Tax=Haliotis cracherodii TaxID=6455 RepID=UPI0039E83BE1
MPCRYELKATVLAKGYMASKGIALTVLNSTGPSRVLDIHGWGSPRKTCDFPTDATRTSSSTWSVVVGGIVSPRAKNRTRAEMIIDRPAQKNTRGGTADECSDVT